MKKRSILLWTLGVSGAIIVVTTISLIASSGSRHYVPYATRDSSSSYSSSSDSSGFSSSAASEDSGLKLVGEDIVVFTPRTLGYCHALAPADWSVGSSPNGQTMTLVAPDRSGYAAWGVSGVDRGQERYFGDGWGDPETAMILLMNQVLSDMGDASGAQYTSDTEDLGGGWRKREFESDPKRGIAIYTLYGAPFTFAPGSYTLSARYAVVDKQSTSHDWLVALGVAMSIGCTTQLVPSPSSSSSSSHRGADESDELKDYNSQLGTQWAHSPSTGENFYLDRSADYNENGPDGPGYYRKAGNSYEKLDMGWSSN